MRDKDSMDCFVCAKHVAFSISTIFGARSTPSVGGAIPTISYRGFKNDVAPNRKPERFSIILHRSRS